MVTWSHGALTLTARLGDGEHFELGPRLKGNLRLLNWEGKSLLHLLCLIPLGFDIHHPACFFVYPLVQSIVRPSQPAWP